MRALALLTLTAVACSSSPDTGSTDASAQIEDGGAHDASTVPYDGGANQWTRIVTSESFPAGYAGHLNRRFWCSFVWDSDENRILFYEGYLGDHGQTAGSIYANTLYSLTLDPGTLRLLNLTDSWTNPASDSYTTVNSPPTEPHPRHTYAAFAYVSGRKELYLASGACAHDPATCPVPDSWVYSMATQKWTSIAIPNDGKFGGYSGTLAGLPGANDLWYFSPRNDGSTWLVIYQLDLDTKQWSAAVNYGTAISGLIHAAADPIRQRLLVWNQQNSLPHLYWFNPATKTLDAGPALPAGFPVSGSIAYVPDADQFLFYDAPNRSLWSLSVGTGTIAEVQDTGDPGKRIDHYLAWDATAKALVTMNIDGEFWVMHYQP